MARMIGIDLGTTNSVVAVMDGPQAKVLDNKEAKPQTRSVVGLRRRRGKDAEGEGEILVGDAALDNWPMAPKDTIVSVKRLMGRGVADPEVQRLREHALYEIVEPSRGTKDSLRVMMGQKEYSSVEISALILKKLREDAEYRLGEEVTHAVITVPAYFGQAQKAATREAGQKAGMTVIKILDEPTAAAIAFGMDSSDGGDAKTILVYDLGGGTFDISVLMMAGNVFAPLNLEGDMWLGGDNFDQVLIDHAVQRTKQDYGIDPTGNMRFMVALKNAAQAVKERLSSARAADLIVAGMLQDGSSNLIDVEIEVTREEYERMIRPLVDRTMSIVQKAMDNANLTREQIDYVLMAGNATCVPLVQQAMEDVFGKDKVLRRIHPKHSVALGAAIAAARIGDRIVCQAPDPADDKRECGYVNSAEAEVCEKCSSPLDVSKAAEDAESPAGPVIRVGGITSYAYGTQSAGDKFNVFIHKSDTYPTENPQTQTFYNRMPNQRVISVPVYGGDDLEKASRNIKQGDAFAILPPGLPQDSPVLIKLWLDVDCVFDLSAHLADGTSLDPWITHGESDAKAVEVIEQMEKMIAEHSGDVPDVEDARNRVFDEMRRHNPDEALERAQDLVGRLRAAPSESGGPPLETKAENLIRFSEFLLHTYSWALNPEQTYKLTNLVEETRGALAGGDSQVLERKVHELDKLTDSIPDVVRLLLGLRARINGRIQPRDPVLGAELMGELEAVENALKSHDGSAMLKLAALASRAAEGSTGSDIPGGNRCSKGHPVPAGQRNCPECDEDTWLVNAKATGGSSGEIRSV